MAKHSKVVIQRAKHISQIKRSNLVRDISRDRFVKSQTTSKFWRFFFGVLGLIGIVFLVFAFFKKSQGGSVLSFSSFLDWLSNRSSFKISINISDYFIGGDWGLFDGFRNFLNIFAQLSGCLAWLGANLINIIIFLAQFLLFLFS